MGLFLDVLTVLVFIVTIYHAYKKGLVRAIIEFLGFIVAFAISYVLSAPFGEWINKTFLNKYVHGSIAQMTASNGNTAQSAAFTQMISQMPASIGNSLKNISSGLGSVGSKAAEGIISAVTMPLASVISRGIAFFILLMLCLVAVNLVVRLSDGIVHIPVIKTVNALGGAVVGIFEAMLIMFFISTLIALLISFMALSKNPPITSSTVNATHVYKYVNDVNPLTGILLKK